MITADTALITAIGNKPEDRTRVIDASISEAARVTRAHGYRYFVILNAADATQTGRMIVVPNRVHRDMVGDGLPGNSNLPTTTDVFGNFAPVGESVAYSKPGIDITIRMYREGEVDASKEGVWNSDTVLSAASRKP